MAAARAIARERGIAAVTHRTVAERAGVPLGSTTYYFTSIDDLLAQAIRLDISEFQQRLAGALPSGEDRQDAAAQLIAFLCDEAQQTDNLLGEYGLYLAAFTRRALRPLALEWTETSVTAYSRYVRRELATAIAMLFDGYAVRTAFAGTDQFPERGELTQQLMRLTKDTSRRGAPS